MENLGCLVCRKNPQGDCGSLNQIIPFKPNECVTPEISQHVLHQRDASALIFERFPSSSHCDDQRDTLVNNSLSNFTRFDLDVREEYEELNNSAQSRRKRRILFDAHRLKKKQKKGVLTGPRKKDSADILMRSETNRRRRELYAQRRKSQIIDSCMGSARSELAAQLDETLHRIRHSSVTLRESRPQKNIGGIIRVSADLQVCAAGTPHGITQPFTNLGATHTDKPLDEIALPSSNTGASRVLSETTQRKCSEKAKGKKKRTVFSLGDVSEESSRLQEPILCKHCRSILFQYERKGLCCSNGQIVLKVNEVPDELFALFVSSSDEAREFKRCVRIYNSSFAFTSLGVKLDKKFCSMSKGVYTFRAQGQVYHRIKQLVPARDPPAFLQLYFYDTEHEFQHRLNFSDQLSADLLTRIGRLLHVNPYCQFFRALKDVPDLAEQKITIRCDAGLDQRIYNTPTASQVAAVWVDDEPVGGARVHDILVTAHSGDNFNINYCYGCYDPLQYPLLFPYGDNGWHLGIKKKSNRMTVRHIVHDAGVDASVVNSIDELLAHENLALEGPHRWTVSCREYYCYKLQIRPLSRSLLLHAGRLFQQYVVDMYVKVETARLDYFRRKQREIRADLYQGIIDSLEMGRTRGSESGRRVILPASFIGGPRDMRKRYMDAMSLVQRFGKPDIFLTITCNPNWPEIKEQLAENDLPQYRPDLVSRIFRAKIEDLKCDLIKKQIFGRVAAYVYVIEFQKRGLPHAHFLLILQGSSKLVSSDRYDRIVVAELPENGKNPHLYSLVIKHMMHGPCGHLNPKNICMKSNGRCRSQYPKSFCSQTQVGHDSFPLYWRRDDKLVVKVRGRELDNRWVVPYNPYLLAKFDCHMNVEICSTIKAVKYLYKYVYKGHDRVSFSVGSASASNEINEIDMFQTARWVSPPEATWRIFGFVLSEMHPHVLSLQLHLPEGHTITFHGDDELVALVDDDSLKKTMLTEFFRMNSMDRKAKTLLYRQFPEHFVWQKRNRVWTHRKKFGVVGRVVMASPTEGERYYLRLLLNHVTGPTSFDALKTVNGICVQTFREAALLHGLLEGDDNCRLCLQEASSYAMPLALRRLFATVLSCCAPHDPQSLWEQFKASMSEDYLNNGLQLRAAELAALQNINSFLEPKGNNVNEYKLVDFHVNLDLNEKALKMIDDELEIHVSDDDLSTVHNLNPQQKIAYDMIIGKVLSGGTGVFFIDGPGWTGKTYLYRSLLATVRSKKMIALATASSGVAAGILPGGRTAHSRFKIPLQLDNNSICGVSKQSGLAKLLEMANLIIWDEAPMMHRQAIEAVDRMFQDVNSCTLPFGGKVFVFGGDFRQVLPVIQKGTKKDVMQASLVYSHLWQHFTKINLVENMRSKLDPTFSDYLLRIGNGEEPCDSFGRVLLQSNMIIPYIDDVTSLNQLLDAVFPDIDLCTTNLPIMVNRVILTPKNDCVDQINNLLMERFPGEAVRYYSFDQTLDKTEHIFPEEFLNTLVPNGIPPHELVLKKDCPIMLLCNINSAEGLCNGTRLVCKHFERNVIEAEVAAGDYLGKKVFLPRIPFIPLESDSCPFAFKRTQFPIRPCFAMTINKAQGQTLDFVGLYLPDHVFSHGQLYVALSRARTSDCIKVLIKPDIEDPLSFICTKNVVYHDILSLAHQATCEIEEHSS